MGFFSKLAEKAEADELARSVVFDIEHYASPTMNINGDDVELEKSKKPGIWNVIHDDHVVGWINGPTEYLVDHADEIKIVIGEDIPKVRIVKPEDFDEAEEEEFTGKDTSMVGDFLGSGKSAIQNWNHTRKKHKSELSTRIKPHKLKKVLGIGGLNGVIIRQQADGLIYFNNEEKFYRLISYSWSGPQYQPVTSTETVSQTTGKTKRKGRLLGAAVGSMVAPGIGTAIGAMAGTGNKKTNDKTVSQSVSQVGMAEIAMPAVLVLEEVDSGAQIRLDFDCLSETDKTLSQFAFGTISRAAASNRENKVTNPSSSSPLDPYEELKKLKELLDMGILTQDEFDKKKSELLRL